MKKFISLIMVMVLMLCALSCLTACGNEAADPNQDTEPPVQEENNTDKNSDAAPVNNDSSKEQNNNQNNDHNNNKAGASLPDNLKTDGTPAGKVTKVKFEAEGSGAMILFEFDNRDTLGCVEVMYTDIYNSETNTWERCNECSPCDGFVARVFFDTKEHIGTYSKIRCICMADKDYADSVYEQDIDLKISRDEASSLAASAEYVKNAEGAYDITIKGVEGNRVIIRAYSDASYDSQQLFTDRNVEGPQFFFPAARPIEGKEDLAANGYYCILQLDETIKDPASLSLAFTDVSGWKKIME